MTLPLSLAYKRGRLDYSEKGFDQNPYAERTPNWRDWNNGWRDAMVDDPLLDDDEKGALA